LSADQSKCILAIDLGTSALKVALVTTDGQVAACESLPMQVTLLPRGGAEQDPEDWWRGIVCAAKSLLAQNAVPANDVVAVSCSAQWSGTVAVDRDGHALMPAIIWMDSRGGPYVKQLTGGLIEIAGYGLRRLLTWVRMTGGAPAHSGKDPIAHILYIKHKRPEVYAATYKFLEPKDYLNLRLTGKFATSYDSIILHWVTDNRHISKIVYSERLLKLAGIDREKLPDLKPAVDLLGPIKPEVARELGLNENVQVVMGTPDLQAAALGSGAIRDVESHLYIGTSSFLICHVPFKKIDLFRNMASLPSPIPNRYFLANEQESAGICLTY
jgi:xylulokinase